MKSFHNFVRLAFAVVLLGWPLGTALTASAQAVQSADAGGPLLSVGGTASGYYLQYGQIKLLGASVFVDADTRRHFGVEAEARWLQFHQTNDVHDATYMVGPRYYREIGRFQPYVKVLAGVGEFNFPYNYATGSYLVVAPGGGLDYRINRLIRIRVADVEYQLWPQFTYSSMSSVGVSTGIRLRIF
jgi:hypothetical protein